MKTYKDYLLRVQGVVEQARDTLEQVLRDDDDLVLAAETIFDGGNMKNEPNILQQARERVAQLQKEASAALEIKRKLEASAKLEREEKDRNANVINIPRRLGTDQIMKFFGPLRVKEQPDTMSDDTRLWLQKNASEKLPTVAVVPELTLQQRAKFAHIEYVEACYRLGAAKTELQQLEKKVAEMAALMRCVEEAA